MYHYDFSSAVAVGMRVFFGRTSMSGPASMPNAIAAIERFEANGLFQITQFALSTPKLQPGTVPGHRDPGGDIPAVFQPSQTLDDDWNHAFLADVPDNATHRKTSKHPGPTRPGRNET